MNDWLQLAIAGLIVCAVFFAVWKHGRSNPQDTGTLGRRLVKVEESLKSCATRGSLDLLAEQVRNLEAHAASSAEVIAIEGKINMLAERVAAVKDVGDQTRGGVNRIEAILMKDALKR